jgi:diguanylate cyclase (GGDEF)-like protein
MSSPERSIGVASSRQRSRLVARHAKSHEPVSVLMFDLEHFKSINDRFGHPTGDETLKLFAAITSSSMRSSDVFARFGGEEFVAMLPCSLADATVAAERVRLAFQAAAGMVAGCPLAATVSVGAASAALCADVAALLAAANQALYRARAKGRNRIESVEQELPIMLTRNPAMVRDNGDIAASHVDARTAPAA